MTKALVAAVQGVFWLVGLCLLVLVAATPSWGDTTFTDGTFNLSDYNIVTFNSDPSDVTINVSQTSSGNPGTALEVINSWSAPNITFSTAVALLNTSFIFNPSSQGGIQNLNFSVDRFITLTGGILGGTNNASALVLQNGNYYFDTVAGPTLIAGQYQTVSGTGLLASDFQLIDLSTGNIDTTQHPDFSSSGGAIDFGILVRFGHINALPVGGNLDVREDNLSYSITPVPEPSSLLLLLSGLAPFVALRRRR